MHTRNHCHIHSRLKKHKTTHSKHHSTDLFILFPPFFSNKTNLPKKNPGISQCSLKTPPRSPCFPIGRVPVFLRIQHEQLGKELLPVHHTRPTRTFETAMQAPWTGWKMATWVEGLKTKRKDVEKGWFQGLPNSHTTPNPESLKMWGIVWVPLTIMWFYKSI